MGQDRQETRPVKEPGQPTRRTALQGLLGLPALVTLAPAAVAAETQSAEPTNILIVIGPSNHPPGTHEVAAGGRLLGHCLENADNLKKIKATVVTGWPEDQALLARTQAVVFIGDTFPPQRMPGTSAILSQLGALMDRGCGLACIHYATGLWGQDVGPKGEHPLLGWLGGYFANKTCPHHQGIARVFPAAPHNPGRAHPPHLPRLARVHHPRRALHPQLFRWAG